ncbi:MAG: gamma-glutamyl-phosphate reductase, partial [Verrucomicrobiota bacterium]|nr:gamma-glutamyl-phosphate reductase [Verrucomicrobiota bacterium]
MTNDQITELVVDISKRARIASLELAALPTETKNNFLLDLAEQLLTQIDAIIEANTHDLKAAKSLDLSAPMTERLTLTPERIAAMAEGVRQVAALPDPVGIEIE